VWPNPAFHFTEKRFGVIFKACVAQRHGWGKKILRLLEIPKAGSGRAGRIDSKRTLAREFDLTICRMRVAFLGTFAISCYAL
jgi:hypothetical protein